MTRKLTLFTIVFALAVAAFPAASPAAVTVGLGDQSWNTFSDGHFTDLGLKRVRVVTPWNVALTPRQQALARRIPHRPRAPPGSIRS